MSKKRSVSITDSSSKSKVHKVKKLKSIPSSSLTPDIQNSSVDHPLEIRSKKSKVTIPPSNPTGDSDQIAFPRGGGISLTSYQQAEAKRDGAQQAEQLVRSFPLSQSKNYSSKRPSSEAQNKPKKVKTHGDQDHIVEAHRIEHLNFKRLIPGIKLAGIIIQITPLALIVALPSHLIAHVPVSEISFFYTKRLEESVEQDDQQSQTSSNHSSQSDSSPHDLYQMFSVGQWIRCSVLKISPSAPRHDSKSASFVRAAMKVTLTLDPTHVNSGIDKSNLHNGMTLTGAVRSIEDRGYIIDFGIPINPNTTSVTSQPHSNNYTAFVSFSEAEQPTGLNHKDNSSSQWEIGQIVWCRINKVSDNGTTCVVSVNHQDLSRSMLTTILNIDSILPLHMVSCQVTAVIPSRGLNVIFSGFFKGSIDFPHLGLDELDDHALNQKFRVGQKITARILWDSIPSKNHASFDDHEPILGPKIFSLTLLHHSIKQEFPALPMELSTEQPTAHLYKIDQIVQYPIGYIFQTVRIYRVEEEWGLYASCITKVDGLPIERTPNGKLPIGFAHISAITDSFLPSLSEVSGPYKVGSTHVARVTGISPVDGCLQLSLQPSVIGLNFMRTEDIPTGASLDVEIKALTPIMLLVKINEKMEGIVWPEHYSDFKLRQPERKFNPGSKVKARVLYTNPKKNQVVLTLRKTWVSPETEIISSYESARVGAVTYGLVREVKEKSIVICFFGRTRGTIGIGQADQKFVESMSDIFSPGDSIKVKVTAVNVERKKIFATSKFTTDEPGKTPTALGIGDQVSAYVAHIGPDHVRLDLYQLGAKPSTSDAVRGLISLTLLASKQGCSTDDLRTQLKKGDEIKDLTVTRQDKVKNILIAGFTSPARKSKFTTDEVPSLSVGDQVTGIIRFVHQKHLVLHLHSDNQKPSAPVEGFLSLALLARKQKLSLEALRSSQLIGQKISGLQVAHQNVERGLLMVRFPNLKSDEPAPDLDLDHSEPQSLSPDDRVIGRICGISQTSITMDLRKEGTEGYADKRGIISTLKFAKRLVLPIADVLSTTKLGDYVSELMVRKLSEGDNLYLLKFSPSEGNLKLASGSLDTLNPKSLPLSIGDSVVGTVQAIHQKNVVFSLQKDGCQNIQDSVPSRGIMLCKLLAGHWKMDVKYLPYRIKEGDILRKLVVKKIDAGRQLMIVGFANTSADLPPGIKLGMILKVRITGRNAQGMLVTPVDDLATESIFTISLTDINDDYDEKNNLEVGSTVSAVVVRADKFSSKVCLSTRQSDLNKSSVQSHTKFIKDPPVRSLQLPKGHVVRAFVQKKSPLLGLTLQVGTVLNGTVPLSKLPADWNDKFQNWQVVSAKTTGSFSSRTVYMTLLDSSNIPKGQVNREDLKVGQTLSVQVAKIESYGMFLQVPGTSIRGLCYSGEVYDEEEDFKSRFRQDCMNNKFTKKMHLEASILELDDQNKKIAFTIKPSVVNCQPEAQLTDAQDLVADEEPGGISDQDKQENSDESSDDETSDPGHLSHSASKAVPEPLVKQPTTASIDLTEPSLPLSAGFSWNTDQSKHPVEAVSSDEESTNGNYFTKMRVKGSHMNGNSVEDNAITELEKTLLESPNSSRQWIRLIQIFIHSGEINKARETAKRALEAIHYREENEKWKVWICLLHLEEAYGTEEQFSATFKEAATCNDSKTVWLKVAEIYSKNGKLEKAEETYTQAIKKFRESCKVWCLYGAFCLQSNRQDQYADLLSRSLKSLPQRKHIKTVTKFAQSEFKIGGAERGRTIFEGLLNAYPKRTDLWKVYLDMEIKSGTTVDRIRGLFSRMMELKLNPAKTKSIFKRWYNFEITHGDKESQEMVIEKAQSYVSSLIIPSSSSQRHQQSPSSKDDRQYNLIDNEDDGQD